MKNFPELTGLPVQLIRWIKNPDLCPAEYLAWLAWGRNIADWDETWPEEKKRDAIRQAYAGHCRHGTVGAVKLAAEGFAFPVDISEWFNQSPPGEPYTFSLDIPQGNSPVSEQDFSALVSAVSRAKNLRSHFGVAVRGERRAAVCGAGYIRATEMSRPRVMASQIVLTPETVTLVAGETRHVNVTILPGNVDDRSFTAVIADNSVADLSVSGNILTLSARTWGESTVTVTTSNGVTAVLNLRVVAAAKFVVQFNDASRALFFVGNRENDFTVDYGDGVDSRDYTLDGIRVMATRDIPPGAELTLTVKNAEGVMFFSPNFPGNPLLEIIWVSGTRTSMAQFAKNQSTLCKIHPGAFDGLPEVTTFSGAFANCAGLKGLPDGVFGKTDKVESFRETFAYAGLQALPERVFTGLSRASDFYRLCIRCPLEALPEGLFAGTAGQNFEYAFYGCTKLTVLPDRLFDIHPSSTQKVNLTFAFQDCTGLTTLPQGLFDKIMPNISSLYNTFTGCSSLVTLPPGLLTGTPACTDFRQTFSGCRNITGDINAIFTGEYPSGCNLLNLFYRCSRLTGSKSAFLAKFPAPSSTNNTFYGCSSLTD
ncbi:phage tail protein I [Salmonella enterica subsp. enterica]|uniref:phage tail protein I n=1 Tax=Salmonella enterica TaxID=28901 RepID=UPI0012CF26EB|nr:phage tail protein I [Salmonella enterica]EBG6922885.1 phage tail protein I [Salmonella enterica subsp. enterica]EBW9496446.1 phage tail protein I [Salmonella enterica subsp. enterica serovar Brandenburg]ECB7382891.1 phage tail protein I [Salmonella enterica subsp. enterica serovar Brandenburg]ECN6005674.1 phage tail protein I [Salmonella enterica subsp. enterica serovar Brandenburg]EIS1578257.1 phage tail protein I [Salmonella enterica subsp. enterica serovar Brandenburg]